jgi:hypothetical protein
MRKAPVTLRDCDWNFSGLLTVQLARQPGFWRYAIEVKPFVRRLARDPVYKLSKRGLQLAVEYREAPVGRRWRLP